jgi:UDP-glucose 4-epimerase
MSVPPRLLVTGAAGFVGGAVARLGVARGLDVVAAVGPHSHLDRLAPVAREVEVVRMDVTDADAVAATVSGARPDVCVHLVAAGAVVREDDLNLLLATNAHAPARLAGELARVGCSRLVTAGSSSEYGTVKGPMDEAAACDPDDPYGVAKLAGGLLARVVARQHGLESAHLRLFSVYGPGEDPRRLVPTVIRDLLARRPVALTPGGQVRDFVYVDDVVAANLAALGVSVPTGETSIFNVGTGRATSVNDIWRVIEHIAQPRVTAYHEPARSGDVRRSVLDASRAARGLGWRPAVPIEDGLARTWTWFVAEAGRMAVEAA